MERNYFALTGNEFGVHMPMQVDLKTEAEAMMDFIHGRELYGCAALYKVENGQIQLVNQECDF